MACVSIQTSYLGSDILINARPSISFLDLGGSIRGWFEVEIGHGTYFVHKIHI